MKECACPNCNTWKLCWDSDESSDEVGFIEDGVVSFYHCTHCGAQMELFVPFENEYAEEQT